MHCNEIVKDEALQNPEMGFVWITVVNEFKGTEEHLNSVVLKHLKTNELIDIPKE